MRRTVLKRGIFAKLKFDIDGDDFREGLTAIYFCEVAEPTTVRRTNKRATTKLWDMLIRLLVIMLALPCSYLRMHPTQTKSIVNKVILAATARHARKARELVTAQKRTHGTGLPGKLADAARMIQVVTGYS